MVDGRLERSISLQGFYRLTEESAGELAKVLDAGSGASAGAGTGTGSGTHS